MCEASIKPCCIIVLVIIHTFARRLISQNYNSHGYDHWISAIGELVAKMDSGRNARIRQ